MGKRRNSGSGGYQLPLPARARRGYYPRCSSAEQGCSHIPAWPDSRVAKGVACGKAVLGSRAMSSCSDVGLSGSHPPGGRIGRVASSQDRDAVGRMSSYVVRSEQRGRRATAVSADPCGCPVSRAPDLPNHRPNAGTGCRGSFLELSAFPGDELYGGHSCRIRDPGARATGRGKYRAAGSGPRATGDFRTDSTRAAVFAPPTGFRKRPVFGDAGPASTTRRDLRAIGIDGQSAGCLSVLLPHGHWRRSELCLLFRGPRLGAS